MQPARGSCTDECLAPGAPSPPEPGPAAAPGSGPYLTKARAASSEGHPPAKSGEGPCAHSPMPSLRHMSGAPPPPAPSWRGWPGTCPCPCHRRGISPAPPPLGSGCARPRASERRAPSRDPRRFARCLAVLTLAA
eukprot:scaffold1201_cov413-Prasinococcus_capsulatus_cf.AAC.9